VDTCHFCDKKPSVIRHWHYLTSDGIYDKLLQVCSIHWLKLYDLYSTESLSYLHKNQVEIMCIKRLEVIEGIGNKLDT